MCLKFASIFATLGVAASANAAVLVSTARTSNAVAGWDKLVFSVSSLTGTDSGKTLTSLGGTFTAIEATSTLSVIGTSSGNNTATPTFDADGYVWGDRTVKTDPSTVSATGPRSFINFASSTPTAGTQIQPSEFLRLADSETPTSFAGSWFTSNQAQRLTTGSTLATIYVTSGFNVSFTGANGRSDATTQSLSFTSVPEPTSLALAGLGAAALIGRRRRVQK